MFGSVEMINSSGPFADAVLPLAGPALLGGKTYRLTSLEYCISPGPGASVVAVFLDSNRPVDFASDLTLRGAAGCYTMDAPALTPSGAQGYHVTFRTFGAEDTKVTFEGVQSTWAEV